MNRSVLITGTAGFIGSHLADELLDGSRDGERLHLAEEIAAHTQHAVYRRGQSGEKQDDGGRRTTRERYSLPKKTQFFCFRIETELETDSMVGRPVVLRILFRRV